MCNIHVNVTARHSLCAQLREPEKLREAFVLNKLGEYAKPFAQGFNHALTTLAELLDNVDRVKLRLISHKVKGYLIALSDAAASLAKASEASSSDLAPVDPDQVKTVAEQLGLHAACMPTDFDERETLLQVAEFMPILCETGSWTAN